MDPRMFAPADLVGAYGQGLQVRQMREQAEKKKRLGDLLPSAMGVPGGGIGGGLPSQQDAMREIAGLNPELFMKLDARQREQAKAELADMTQAVRWADTPEKWAQVQQYYGQKGVDLSGYSVNDRERGMLMLGKLGEYLESAPKMDIRSIEPGGGLYGVDPRTGQVNELVTPNYSTGGQPAPQQSAAPPPPPPGFVIEGGQSGSAPAGGFPPRRP